jgi:hypothetical protein
MIMKVPVTTSTLVIGVVGTASTNFTISASVDTSPLVLNLTTLYGTFITENATISLYVDVEVPATQLTITINSTDDLDIYYKPRKDSIDVY